MVGKSVWLAGTALATLLVAFPAAAQNRTLEDRIRALEQMLGQQPAANDNRSLD